MASRRLGCLTLAAALAGLATASADAAPTVLPRSGSCTLAAGATEEEDAVCALQQGTVKKDAAPALPPIQQVQAKAEAGAVMQATAVAGVQTEAEVIAQHRKEISSEAKEEVNRHGHSEGHAAKSEQKRKKTTKARKAKTDGKGENKWGNEQEDGDFPWYDQDEAVADEMADEGFGIEDEQALQWAQGNLDELPDKAAFDETVGFSGLPLTIGFVNDRAVAMTWDSLEEMDGHVFNAPEDGMTIWPGQMVVVQMYAHSDGLKGRARMVGPFGNWLSVAWQSYRIGSWSCDRLRVLAMRTDDWDEPTNLMCNTNEAGIARMSDYEVIISLKRAE